MLNEPSYDRTDWRLTLRTVKSKLLYADVCLFVCWQCWIIAALCTHAGTGSWLTGETQQFVEHQEKQTSPCAEPVASRHPWQKATWLASCPLLFVTLPVTWRSSWVFPTVCKKKTFCRQWRGNALGETVAFPLKTFGSRSVYCKSFTLALVTVSLGSARKTVAGNPIAQPANLVARQVQSNFKFSNQEIHCWSWHEVLMVNPKNTCKTGFTREKEGNFQIQRTHLISKHSSTCVSPGPVLALMENSAAHLLTRKRSCEHNGPCPPISPLLPPSNIGYMFKSFSSLTEPEAGKPFDCRDT